MKKLFMLFLLAGTFNFALVSCSEKEEEETEMHDHEGHDHEDGEHDHEEE